MRPKVEIYATAWCPYCSRARQLLADKGVEFEEIDVDARPEARAEMIARSGRRWTGLERREQDQGQHDQVRQVLSEDRNRSERLQGGDVARTSHDDIRLRITLIAGPLPHADAFGAMFNGGIH